MSENKETTEEHKTAVAIQSFLIESYGISLEASPAVVDLDIFENFDKPYLTAVVSLVDYDDIFTLLNISGGEKVTIEIKSTHRLGREVTKVFYIDKILESRKIKDDQEFYVIHLIEDIGFIAKTKNINRSYAGTGSTIIAKICQEFLNEKEVALLGGRDIAKMKLIVPNLNPIDAICWVKNRLASIEGYPYYLYSSLVEDRLTIANLEDMLTQDMMNRDIPYTFSESTSSSNENNLMSEIQRRVLLEYNAKDTDNIFKLLHDGFLGSSHSYIDVTKKEEKHNIFVLDVEPDIIQTFNNSGIETRRPIVDVFKYDWNDASILSKVATQIGGTKAYDNNLYSYSEAVDKSRYKSRVVSMAMTNVITKNSVDMIVNGFDFLDGHVNTSIGKRLLVLFLRNNSKIEENTPADEVFDLKKSGGFLITNCKHTFGPESYTISMSLIKTDNADSEALMFLEQIIKGMEDKEND